MKPRLLDLFCGAGGCSAGYVAAGFEVVGVDIADQPNYPFRFHKLDAMEVAYGLMVDVSIIPGYEVGDFDAVHASPPCQFASLVTPDKSKHSNLIPETRRRLQGSGLPYVIENVPGAREHLIDPVQICGSGLGLTLIRHRLFETNFPVMGVPCAHGALKAQFDVYEHGKWRKSGTPAIYGKGGRKAKEHWASAMGINWMTHDEMALAIPPRYTEHIGSYLKAEVERRLEDDPQLGEAHRIINDHFAVEALTRRDVA